MVRDKQTSREATIRAGFLEEPPLEFCGGRLHVDPRSGLSCFGPRTLDQGRHPARIRVGLIGSGASVEHARDWLVSCSQGVAGNADNPRFVGSTDDCGFFSQMIFDDRWVQTVTRSEIKSVTAPELRKDRFQAAVQLISDKMRLLSEQDQVPDYVVMALPDELLEVCMTVEYNDKVEGRIHRDFRLVMKAEAMKYRLPTQILLQRTSEATESAKNVDHKSKCAWNLFTGMYFKAGGIPWSAVGLDAGSCYVGISFFRPLGSTSTARASVAQAFDEHGDGLILRGQDFQWNEHKQGKSPHLDESQIVHLITMVLQRYEREMSQVPRRVVVHKSSRFWPEEQAGFERALQHVKQYDLVSVAPTDSVRLLREGKYPPLRGTRFSVGRYHYLYTTGFIPSLGVYPHGHVPCPLQVTDHVGDSAIAKILDEILILTKMNWNSSAFGGLWPVTLRFSRWVGEIMREIPLDREPLPQFKFYV
jgi:hypothetical protein